MDELPWNINADLMKERILEVGNFLAKVRGEVIDLHDEDLGDTRLSLGVRAYECCRTRMVDQDAQDVWPWLSILTPDKRFTFSIGKTPVRFVRNDPEELPSNKLVLSDEASLQMELNLEDNVEYSDLRWFFVIDTFYKNVADNMYLVGYNENGKIICQWEIPLENTSVMLTEINKGKPQSVPIDKAPIRLKTSSKKTISKDE